MNKILLFIIVLLFTLLGSFGGFSFKKATKEPSIIGILKSPFLYTGVGFYITGAILNIITLKYLPYSVVLPMTSITYIWTLVLSYFLLNEKMTKYKFIGVVMIITGSVFIGISTL